MDGKLTCFNAVIIKLFVRQALEVNGIRSVVTGRGRQHIFH